MDGETEGKVEANGMMRSSFKCSLGGMAGRPGAEVLVIMLKMATREVP